MSSIATANNIQRGMAAPAFGPFMWRLYPQTEVCQSSSEAIEERRAPNLCDVLSSNSCEVPPLETVVVSAMDGGGMGGDMMPLRRIVGGDASNMRQRVADLLTSDYACHRFGPPAGVARLSSHATGRSADRRRGRAKRP